MNYDVWARNTNAVMQAESDARIRLANQSGIQTSTFSSTGDEGGYRGGAKQSPTLLANQYQQKEFDPWSQHREQAGTILAGQMDPKNDPSNMYKDKLAQMSQNGGSFKSEDPSYKWRFAQGQQAVERSAAAKGLLNSGNVAIELQQYGQGAASQEYGAQFSRLLQGMEGVSKQHDTQMTRLMQMAGVNNDPTAAAKMNLGVASENTNRIQVANNYEVGMANAANSRYSAEAAMSQVNAAKNLMVDGGSGGGGFSVGGSSGWDSQDEKNAAWWGHQDAQRENPASNLSASYGSGGWQSSAQRGF
jgi:hypothetical protein